jgi:hypothetical protein
VEPTEQINEAKAAIAEAEAELEAREMAASAVRQAAKGWPIRLLDGTEVMVVKAVTSAAGLPHVVTEGGEEYAPYRNNPHNGYVLVGVDLTSEETEDVAATGTEPPAPTADELAAMGEAPLGPDEEESA